MADLLLFPTAAPQTTPDAIPDAAAREQALDTTQSFLVEAPAGSGKTGLLIQRFLKLLTTDNVSAPAQVLAITFTRKATAEMRDRVFAQLAAARAGEPPANAFDTRSRALAEAVLLKDAQLGWNLLEDPRRLNIRTIDSVCADIARGLPILSGAGGGQSPTEDAAALHTEAAHRTLMLLGGQDAALNAALEDLLLHRDGNLGNCESLIARMLSWRDQWGTLVPLAPSELTEEYLDQIVLPKLDRALELAVCRSLTELNRIIPADILDELCMLAAEMAEADGYKGDPSPIAICRSRTQPPAEKAEDLEHWRAIIHLLVKPSKPRDWRKSVSGNHIGFEILKHHQTNLKRIIAQLAEVPGLVDSLCRIESLPPALYPREQWPTAKSLFRVLSRALVELQIVFSTTGQCDFTEAALQARSALQRDGALDDLRASAALDLQHLLVDEMQDTSSAQYELIHLLTSSWDGYSQTVFLVGDPKQSIYLFRQARVERFIQTMHTATLGDLHLTTLHLTANFRSQRTLVQAFNGVFAMLFPACPDATRPELVPYRAASAVRPASAGAAEVWHTAVLPYSDDREICRQQAHDQAQLNAQSIRKTALQWLSKPLPPDRQEPWKLAVLVRNRTHLLEVIAAFKQAPPVPYRAVNIEPLAERREILDLLALTRALLHPADRTAWLSLLRTPWCGLSLADLHTLSGADDPAFTRTNLIELMESRGELLTPDGIARLEPFWQIMRAAVGTRAHLPLARTVELTSRSFAAHTVATHEEQSNAERFFRLLAELEAEAPLELPRLEQRLAILYATPAVRPGAVDLMTIHGAKGLEWDAVFVPALERKGASDTGRLLSWLETEPGSDEADPAIAPGILAPIQSKGGETELLNGWIRSVDSSREAAERTRLFYVACTRAREELHLFATLEEKKAGGFAPPHGSLLSSAWPAAEQRFKAPQASLPMPGLALAAVAAGPDAARILRRVPLSAMIFTAGVRHAEDEPAPAVFYPRPEGSFAARVFGNTMHTFLQRLTEEVSAGQTFDRLATELPTWQARIGAALRGAGIASTLTERYTANILRGLQNTLAAPEGRWLLNPHPGAATERSVTTWTDDSPISLRLDRTFLAGPAPLSTGSTHLWIVDYKTATHGAEGLQSFLQAEAEKYSPQLHSYAAQLQKENQPIRLALFYPMLGKLHPIP